MPKRSSKPPAEPKPRTGNKTANRGKGVDHDINVAAFNVFQQAVGEALKVEIEEKPEKNPAAVTLGRLGGLKGGKARAESLTPEKRAEIAKSAAAVRWKKS